MNWELVLLIMLWAGCASIVIGLYIDIHLSEWGLIGLMLFLAGAWVLVNRTLMHEAGIDAFRREQVYLWRWLALIGAILLFAARVAAIRRKRPPWRQIVRRLAFAAGVLVIVVCLLNLYLEVTS